MTRFAFALSLALALPLAAQAGTFEITGQNGGTASGTWTCLPVNGILSCSSQTEVTSPSGAAGSRSRSTQISRGDVTSTLSGTRTSGREFGRTLHLHR